MMVLGKGVDNLRERSAAGQRFDDFILIGAAPRFYPSCFDEPSIPAWLNFLGRLPWEVNDEKLKWV